MELVKAGTKSRITGCVLGGLIGDALGAPWEFFSTNFLDKIVGYYFEELMTKPGNFTFLQIVFIIKIYNLYTSARNS
jgi:ADP-ribosylglycohydrolase